MMNFPSAEAHCSNMMKFLHQLKSSGKLCDMALGAEDKKFFVHKCVILAACPILESFIDQQSEYPFISCEEVSAKGLELWIDYIYSGQVLVDSEHHDDFLRVCQTLQPVKTDVEKNPEIENSQVSSDGNVLETVDAVEDGIGESSDVLDDMEGISSLITLNSSSSGDEQSTLFTKLDIEAKEKSSPQKSKKPSPTKASESKVAEKRTPQHAPKTTKRGSKRKSTIFACPFRGCSEKATTRRQIERHYNAQHRERKKHKCKKCDEEFNRAKSLREHQKVHIGEKTVNCEVCGKTFLHKKLLKNHSRVHDDTRSNEVCKICGIVYLYERSLERHMKRKHGAEEAQSGGSSQQSNGTEIISSAAEQAGVLDDENESELSKRRRIASDTESVPYAPPFICTYEGCGKETDSRLKLLKHMTYHRERRYPCDFCDRKFLYRKDKVVHERVHTGDRPYSCEICGKKFKQKCTLENHAVSHKKTAKDEVCNICGLAYAYKKSLAFHMKDKHGNDNLNLHHCDRCGRNYSSLSRFTIHLERCTPPRNKCVQCGKLLKSGKQLQDHLKTCLDEDEDDARPGYRTSRSKRRQDSAATKLPKTIVNVLIPLDDLQPTSEISDGGSS